MQDTRWGQNLDYFTWKISVRWNYFIMVFINIPREKGKLKMSTAITSKLLDNCFYLHLFFCNQLQETFQIYVMTIVTWYLLVSQSSVILCLTFYSQNYSIRQDKYYLLHCTNKQTEGQNLSGYLKVFLQQWEKTKLCFFPIKLVFFLLPTPLQNQSCGTTC